MDEAESWLVADTEGRGPDSPAEALERSELQDEMRRAIESLADAEREIIVLREFQEMSYKDIASLLDIPMGTVMSRLYAARKQLARKLEFIR